MESERKRMGGRNTKNRLREMCQGDMKIESEPGKGTKIEIQIPVKEEHE